jgi:LysM repeat protein
VFARFIAIALAATVMWAVAAHSSSGAGPEQTYTVKYGDTLWSIASEHYAGDVRSSIWKVQKRNGLHGATIVPGQRLKLP